MPVLLLAFAIIRAEGVFAQTQIDVTWPFDVPTGQDHRDYVIPTNHHSGIFAGATDFRLPVGTEMLAVADGKVISVYSNVPDGEYRSITSLNRCVIECTVIVDGKAETTRFPLVEGQEHTIGFGQGEIGNYVTLEHTSAFGEIFYVSYFHLQSSVTSGIILQKNDLVTRGQVIGKVGLTGYRTGAHSHFQAGRSEQGRVAISNANDANLLNFTSIQSEDLEQLITSQDALNLNITKQGVSYSVTYNGSVNSLQVRDSSNKLVSLSSELLADIHNSARAIYILTRPSVVTPNAFLIDAVGYSHVVKNVMIEDERIDDLILWLDLLGLATTGYSSDLSINRIVREALEDGLSDPTLATRVSRVARDFTFDAKDIHSVDVLLTVIADGLISPSSNLQNLSESELQEFLFNAATNRISVNRDIIEGISVELARGQVPTTELSVTDIERVWAAYGEIVSSAAIHGTILEQLGEEVGLRQGIEIWASSVGALPGIGLLWSVGTDAVGSFIDIVGILDGEQTINELKSILDDNYNSSGVIVPAYENLTAVNFQRRSGREGSDFMQGTSDEDNLRGVSGDDFLFGGKKNDVLDGGLGKDTAIYNGRRSDYSVVETSLNNHRVIGEDGEDRLIDMELLSFSGHIGLPIDLVIQNNANSDTTGGSIVPPSNNTSYPDFTTSITGVTGNVVSGGFVTVEFAVKNEGTSYGAVAPLGMYLSYDANPSSNDLLLGAVNISGLSSGQSYSGVISRRTPNWETGEYYVYVVADSDSQSFSVSSSGDVTETSDANNRSALVAISLTSQPNVNTGTGGSSSTVDPIDDPRVQSITREIGSSPSTAAVLDLNSFVTSDIDLGGDSDWFEVKLERNERYIILMSSYGPSPLSDSFFRIRDENGTILSPTRDSDDTSYGNSNGTLHALLVYTAQRSGTHYISVGAGDPQNFRNLSGGYILIVANSEFEPTASGPDLILTDLDISDNTLNLNQQITIDFVLENIGTGDADHAEIDFFLSTTPNLSGTLHHLSTWRDSSGLRDGRSVSDDRNPNIPLDLLAGEYYLVAYVDPDDEVAEASEGETNNVFVMNQIVTVNAPSGPDIDLLNNVTLSHSIIENGERLTVYWTAENDGDVESLITDVHFYLSKDINFNPDEDLYVSTDGLGRLDPGEKEVDDETINLPDHVFAGDYYVLVVADGTHSIIEQDENNNIENSPKFTITDHTRPDLIITSTELDFNNIESTVLIPGQVGKIDYDIENIGDVDATYDNRNITIDDDRGERVEVFAYLSTDTTYSADDVFLGAEDAGNMSVGEVNSETIAFIVPDSVQFGDYYILVLADGHGSFPEVYEDNNFGLPQAMSYKAGSAGDGPDFSVELTNVDTVSVYPGEDIKVEFYTYNSGMMDGDFDKTSVFVSENFNLIQDSAIYRDDSNGRNIDIGESDRGRDTIDTSLFKPGPYYIHIVTNPDQVFVESDYTNNAITPIAIEILAISEINVEEISVQLYTGDGGSFNILSNDLINGVLPTKDNVIITLVDNGGLEDIIIDSDGNLSIPDGVQPGTYMLSFEICERARPSNCALKAVEIIISNPAILVTVEDAVSLLSTDSASVDVLQNDSIDGAIPTSSTVVVDLLSSDLDGNISLNTEGVLEVSAGLSANDYVVSYEVCERSNPDNCSESTVRILVTDPTEIQAINDNVSLETNNTATVNLLSNDNLGGVTPSGGAVLISIIDYAGLNQITLDNQGILTIPSGLTAGNYSIEYQICEAADDDNCASATVSISVRASQPSQPSQPAVSTGGQSGGGSFGFLILFLLMIARKFRSKQSDEKRLCA